MLHRVVLSLEAGSHYAVGIANPEKHLGLVAVLNVQKRLGHHTNQFSGVSEVALLRSVKVVYEKTEVDQTVVAAGTMPSFFLHGCPPVEVGALGKLVGKALILEALDSGLAERHYDGLGVRGSFCDDLP